MKPKCLSIQEWINKIWYSCAQVILYSTENKLAKFIQHLSSIVGWKKAAIKRLCVSPLARSLSCIQLFVTPWAVTRQTPPSMGFSRQEHWREVPSPQPGDLPDPRTEPASPALAGLVDSLPPSHQGRHKKTACFHLWRSKILNFKRKMVSRSPHSKILIPTQDHKACVICLLPVSLILSHPTCLTPAWTKDMSKKNTFFMHSSSTAFSCPP